MGKQVFGKSRSLLQSILITHVKSVNIRKLLSRKHRTKEAFSTYQGGYIADTPGFSALDLE